MTSSGYESYAPSEDQLKEAYLGVNVSVATAIDGVESGLVTGATPAGTETSRTIKNAFTIVAQVYSGNLETLSLGGQDIVNSLAEGATAVALKETSKGDNASVIGVYANADTTVYVVYSLPVGESKDASVYAVAVEGGK